MKALKSGASVFKSVNEKKAKTQKQFSSKFCIIRTRKTHSSGDKRMKCRNILLRTLLFFCVIIIFSINNLRDYQLLPVSSGLVLFETDTEKVERKKLLPAWLQNSTQSSDT